MSALRVLLILPLSVLAPPGALSGQPFVKECESPSPAWIWCDDFERNRLSRYYEYRSAGDAFTRVAGTGVLGSIGMRAVFQEGTVDAGFLHLAFGRTPRRYFAPVDAGTRAYREIYWRFFLRYEPGWAGGLGEKLTRTTIFGADSGFAQAMAVHIWGGSGPRDAPWRLEVVPVRGVSDSGNIRTSRFNDFGAFTWLARTRSRETREEITVDGRWHCIEARVQLNSPRLANGRADLWLDGDTEASVIQLDLVSSYERFGVNAIFLENYWNVGSPHRQARVFDNFVVSTERIGCGPDALSPESPPFQDTP